jgi:hypothetical protein
VAARDGGIRQSPGLTARLCVGDVLGVPGQAWADTTGALVAARDVVHCAPCGVHVYTDGQSVGGAVAQRDRGSNVVAPERMHDWVTPRADHASTVGATGRVDST